MKPGYKQTEVGVIPEDWEVRSISRIGPVVTGGTPPTSVPDYWNGSIPWITPTDIGEKPRIARGDRSITAAGLERIRRVPANSVLVTCIASIGKNAILAQDGGCNQQINAVLVRDRSDAAFLYYSIELAVPRLLSSAGTTATAIVSKKQFETFLLPWVPRPAERSAIAEALSDADALIESLEALIAKKRQIKQGAMQELLTGKRRLPGFSGDWETKRLGEVANMASGGTPAADPRNFGGGLPWVSISDMTAARARFIATTERTLSKRGVDNSAAQLFPPRTVLYAMYASIGEVVISTVPVTTSQAILGIRPLPQLDVDFLYYFLASVKEHVKSLGQQGTQANLNKAIVQSFVIRLPKLEEQRAIAAVLSDLDSELEALETKLEKARAIKQGMMQELLTGRTRLVPAEVS